MEAQTQIWWVPNSGGRKRGGPKGRGFTRCPESSNVRFSWFPKIKRLRSPTEVHATPVYFEQKFQKSLDRGGDPKGGEPTFRFCLCVLCVLCVFSVCSVCVVCLCVCQDESIN